MLCRTLCLQHAILESALVSSVGALFNAWSSFLLSPMAKRGAAGGATTAARISKKSRVAAKAKATAVAKAAATPTALAVAANAPGDGAAPAALQPPHAKTPPASRIAPTPEAHAAPRGGISNKNAVVYAKFEQDKATLQGHSMFHDITVANPIADGPKACYDDDSYKSAMVQHRCCEVGHSIFVLNPAMYPSSGVTINPKKIRLLKEQFFSSDTKDKFPYPLYGAVRSGEVPGPGTVALLSPPEMLFAAVEAAAEKVKASVDDEEAERVRNNLLLVTIMFEEVDSEEDRLWRCHNLRAAHVGVGDAVKLSLMEKMEAVVEIKALVASWEGVSIEEMGAEQTANIWNKHVNEGALQEGITVGFIDAAQTVINRTDDPVIQGLFRLQDDLDVPVFTSVYQVEGVVKKAGTMAKIRWSLSGLVDSVLHRGVSPGELAVKKLTGKGLPGGKGLVDTLIGQYDLATTLTSWARTNGMEENLLKKMDYWCATGFHEFRMDMAQQRDQGVLRDASWVSTCKKSSQLMIKLYEDSIMLNLFKDLVMHVKLTGSSMESVLQKSPILDRLEVITEARTSELGGKPESQPSAQSDAGPVNIGDIEEVQLFSSLGSHMRTYPRPSFAL